VKEQALNYAITSVKRIQEKQHYCSKTNENLQEAIEEGK
jgi:hypothetical protein